MQNPYGSNEAYCLYQRITLSLQWMRVQWFLPSDLRQTNGQEELALGDGFGWIFFFSDMAKTENRKRHVKQGSFSLDVGRT